MFSLPATPAVARDERAEKGEERLALFGPQIQGADVFVEVGIRIASPNVERKDGFQRGQAAVVHVRSGACGGTKRGGVEASPVLFSPSDRVSAGVAETP